MPVTVQTQVEENKRINELNAKTTGFNQGPIPGYNPISDKTEQATVQQHFGAIRASFDWQVGSAYATDDLRFSNYRAWRSLADSNLGNKPSEGVWWTEEPISIADGIGDTPWAAGVFTYNNSKVIVGNTQYYLQTAAPFKSSDFATELANGDWAVAGGGGTEVWANFDDVIKTLDESTEELIFTNPDYDADWTFPTIASSVGSEKEITNASLNTLTMYPDGSEKIWDGAENASFIISSGASKRFKNNGIYWIVK